MKPLRNVAPAMNALFFSGIVGCVATLPFDELSGGEPRPVSIYRFDVDQGAVASDATGKNPGLVQSEETAGFPKWTPNGKSGGALELANDGWLTVPNLSGPNFPTRGTLAFWAKVHQHDPEGTDLFEANEESDESPLFLFMTDKGIFFERSTATDLGDVSATPAVGTETWVLIACGWDIPAKRAILYARVDGRDAFPLQTGSVPESLTLKNPGFYLSITNGLLDEVRFYDHVLTDKELKTLD